MKVLFAIAGLSGIFAGSFAMAPSSAPSPSMAAQLTLPRVYMGPGNWAGAARVTGTYSGFISTPQLDVNVSDPGVSIHDIEIVQDAGGKGMYSFTLAYGPGIRNFDLYVLAHDGGGDVGRDHCTSAKEVITRR